MDPSNDVIEPRHEARPLSFERLTEEQRNAGEQATRLLRGMAREPWTRASRQSPVHSYLPVIYKDNHSNRVALLDGARGSGKSALLITLLDAYGRALSEQRVPDKYEAWIKLEDRIVPAGLLDLQPLPASTHLLFHLVASLERVVEAMETRHEPSRVGTAAWHPGGDNESKSRRTWKRFARVAASGWDDNLNERKGKLDPEAFAVEVEQGELQRLDVNQAFREFIDALVDDYSSWNHWPHGTSPLFVLAIDDADMNEDLSIQLLELVRKLWHQRLVFLLTGHSNLFIDRLTNSHGNSALEATEPRAMQQRQLALDRYAKIIPVQHRFALKELAPGQRLFQSPRIKEYLKSIQVPVQKLPLGRPGGTLLDYFEEDSQVLTALPGRLRLLEELADLLKPIAAKPSTPSRLQASSEAVLAIWQLAIRAEFNEARLSSMIEIDSAGRLVVEDGLVVDWEMEPKTSVSAPLIDLVFEVPIRARISREATRESQLGFQSSATLRLALNVIADTGAERATSRATNMGMPMLAHATLKGNFGDGPTAHSWPLPEWNSFLDIELMRKEWEKVLASAKTSDANLAEHMAKEFLLLVLRAGIGVQDNGAKPEQNEPLAWSDLANQLFRALPLEKGYTRRRQALSIWALGQAGLLAAPEAGLPAKVANDFLDALHESFQPVWQRVRQTLRLTRRRHITSRLREEGSEALDTQVIQELISNIDQRFSEHQFSQRIEHVESESPERSRVYGNLESDLKNIRLHSLVDITGSTSGDEITLAGYLTPLRSEWLRKSPIAMMEKLRIQLGSLGRYSDAGAFALMRLWKSGCSSTGLADVTRWLLQEQKRLIIAEPYKTRLEQKKTQTASEKAQLQFNQETPIRTSVHVVDTALHPFLDSATVSREAIRALEAILRMAYDHEQDQNQKVSPNKLTRPTRWNGIKTHFQEKYSFHPWPVPPWPTLLEWESIEQSWSGAVQKMQELIADSGTNPDARIIDALAYLFLSHCNQLQNRSRYWESLQLEPSTSDWRALIAGGRRRDHEGNPVRNWLYSQWWEDLILMAAPESGLSTNAAASILEVISGDPINPNVATSARIASALRKLRMSEAGIPEEEVDALLTQIDQASPEHPWVQKFKIWNGTQGT